MSPFKRKHSDSSDDGSLSDFDNDAIDSDSEEAEFDISSALTGKRLKVDSQDQSDGEEDFGVFLNDTMAKRNVKSGTELLKKTKGKAKLAKGEVGGGSFQSMGLHPSLLRSLSLQGYRIPTPIQRLSIPALLSNPPQDLVGMARTGSGKSLAFMVPLVQRLGGRHATTFGARALILIPTRELALQLLKVGKEFARGWNHGKGDHAGDTEKEDTKSQGLRWGLIVGGEGLDEQFEMMTNNPDIIIATPGRLLHLIVEMNLDLKSVQYVVFDEADRLFEMGFETALTEIINRLPASRQTLLFSATLPTSLVEFAKAGLKNPKLVRLDAESKISSDLKMAFFSIKPAEKDACLMSLLRDVIKIPLIESQQQLQDESVINKAKGKKKELVTMPHQTLIFAATKHHVEYLTNLLTTAGYAVSHIYGSLDQAARTYQMDQFRRGLTSILVVTDVAARGIDIPVLENVVNYDFPHGARVFVHRVGRTARAGRQGWAWSFVTHMELPYLVDLQLFLSRPLACEVTEQGDQVYTESMILGPFERSGIDEDMEYLRSLDNANHSLPLLRTVMQRAQAMYERSKGKASSSSYKRAKEMIKDPKWILAGSDTGTHPVLLRGSDKVERRAQAQAKQILLRAVNSFRPAETVFEIGTKGKASTANAALMKERRKALTKSVQRTAASLAWSNADTPDAVASTNKAMEMANEDAIAVSSYNFSHLTLIPNTNLQAVFDTSKTKGFRDQDFYMSHYQKDALTEKGYSLTDGASFLEQARGATFDLAGDEGVADRKKRQLKWDKKKKKFVKGDGVGSDNVKLVKTESGTKLPATYRSGRFDEWKAKTHSSLPRVGEAEGEGSSRRMSGPGGHRFKHQKTTESKPLDKLRNDYERKSRQLKKRVDDGAEDSGGASSSKVKRGKTKVGLGSRYGGKPIGRVKSELKSADDIRKSRKIQEKRKAKNARPSGRKGRR
ncbi:P-loop containing nucleoside triphosphate hydrolase protein [Lentinula boryana]|uniref:RNA helicase n=1 Tax=Lentinula boryana TaxID=40481 RepID=A0ABQ8QUA8_9AGAR|nr:P-loop containing nucleoside triphosphate hydrolase protein [Lentinula boryana]